MKARPISEAEYRARVQEKLERVLATGFQMTALGRHLGMSRQRLNLFRKRGVMRSETVRELDDFLDKYDMQRQEMEQVAPTLEQGAMNIADAKTPIDQIHVVLNNISVFLSAAREGSEQAKLGYIRHNLDLVQNILLPEAEAEIRKSKPLEAQPEEKPRKK